MVLRVCQTPQPPHNMQQCKKGVETRGALLNKGYDPHGLTPR